MLTRDRIGQRAQGFRAFDIYARRLLWLFALGVAHAYLLWDGDILYHYAVCGFFLFPFRSFSQRGLATALLVVASVVLFNTYESVSRTRAQAEAYAQAQQIPAESRSEDEASAITRWERRTRRGQAHEGASEMPRQTYLASIAANFERGVVTCSVELDTLARGRQCREDFRDARLGGDDPKVLGLANGLHRAPRRSDGFGAARYMA